MNSENMNMNLINIARLICSIMVIAIHTMDPNENMGYFVIVSSRVVVLFFFICSGYFLCDKIYEKDFYVKKKNTKIYEVYI